LDDPAFELVHRRVPARSSFCCFQHVKNPRAIAAGAGGVVVGSALVSAIKDSLDRNGKATERAVKAVVCLVAKLAGGVRGAKSKA